MLHRERDRIKRVLDLGKGIPLDDSERIGHWGRYACIACTGYIEVALRLVIQTYVHKKATPQIHAYVVRNLETIQNPKAERFVTVLRCFSESWAIDMESFFTSNQQVKDAIDSLMANRHLIAHGRPCSISLGRVSEYHEQADKAIAFVDEMLNMTGVNGAV